MNPVLDAFSRRSRWLVALLLVAAAAASVFAFGDRAVLSDIRKTFSTVRDSSLDAALEAKVRSALALSRRASGLTIDVAAHARIVSLTGRVPTPEVRAIAEAIVADTPGVAGVENRLEVDPKAVANGYETSLLQRIADLETQVSLQERLRREPLLAGANLKIEVDQGIVVLRGAVASELEHETARQVARAAVGAEHVRDELQALEPGARWRRRSGAPRPVRAVLDRRLRPLAPAGAAARPAACGSRGRCAPRPNACWRRAWRRASPACARSRTS